jgi:hypothetical protein
MQSWNTKAPVPPGGITDVGVEALAMILSNKIFRFSRLDTVDDPDEYSYKNTYGISPA